MLTTCDGHFWIHMGSAFLHSRARMATLAARHVHRGRAWSGRRGAGAPPGHDYTLGLLPPRTGLCCAPFFIARLPHVLCGALRCRARFVPRTCCCRACHSLATACPAPLQTGTPPRTSCARPCRLARLTALREEHQNSHDAACAACTECCTIYILLLRAGTAIKGSAVGGRAGGAREGTMMDVLLVPRGRGGHASEAAGHWQPAHERSLQPAEGRLAVA